MVDVSLFRAVKAECARLGVSVTSVVEYALIEWLGRMEQTRGKRKYGLSVDHDRVAITPVDE